MAVFWSDYIWPLATMVAESVLLLIILLFVIAYMIYADAQNLGGSAAQARSQCGRSLGTFKYSLIF